MTYCSYFCAGQNGLNIRRRIFLQFQIENYTCSTRLWLSYFICDNKHTFGKQMSPDLAMLLAFLLETVDWLDKMAHKHTWKTQSDKTHFSVRPHDFSHASPIKFASYVVFMFVLVCLFRFLWEIILLSYMTYMLVTHFDLSLNLF